MKISGLQLFWMFFTFESGNMLLLTLSPTIASAKQDAWISFLIATVIGMFIVFVYMKVCLLYPNQTFIEFSRTILGKWLGTIVIIIYLVPWYLIIGVILIEFADFTVTILLPATPMWVLILSMILLLIYVNFSGGIEGIGRCSEVFGVIVFLTVIVLVIFSIPNMEFKKLLPVFLDSGFLPIMEGALIPLSFIGETVMVLILGSFLLKPEKGPSSAIWGIALSSSLVTFTCAAVLMTFGPEITSKLRYPAFDAVRFISVMGFIQNLEIIAVLVWVLSIFIKLSLYFFITSFGTAQLLGIKDWRKMIWFVAVISFMLTKIFPNTTLFGAEFTQKFWNPFILPLNMFAIPLLLWTVGSIRKRRAAIG
ncbi:GerAB/ArcD/ProY family transporter [Bacillus sp. UNC438CL73TsuS30]|uniref:GerAB/ArcD/ProY family transporter n=1 Tax=Bacillus sp. UNC438CL73TsuS30 TaxID=1340434 RepID=UPI00047B7A21|nr:endospore germination permease [Bacillus sp. UNC438CL73TsuS30]